MKKLIIITVLFLQFSCGKTDCEDQLNNIVSARSLYSATGTDESCIALRDQIEKFLKNPCTINEQVNYAAIFKKESNALPCYSNNTNDDKCVSSLKSILNTGKKYNSTSSTQDCEAYKAALEKYINDKCLDFAQYQATLQNLPCF